MKKYNLIKNIMTASATATLYYSQIASSTEMGVKVFASVAMFIVIMFLLRDVDKYFLC